MVSKTIDRGSIPLASANGVEEQMSADPAIWWKMLVTNVSGQRNPINPKASVNLTGPTGEMCGFRSTLNRPYRGIAKWLKASDFGSDIRRFESYFLCQAKIRKERYVRSNRISNYGRSHRVLVRKQQIASILSVFDTENAKYR